MSSLRTRFGAYLLTDCIGQGGMAVVYRAKREGWSGFEKTVVVKAMLPTLAAHREHVDRFIAEAKIQAQLSHPGIVQVHDFGVFQGTPYLVMEHLNGVNLSQLLNACAQTRRKIPVPVALVIATQICHALGYAHTFRDANGHKRQIIHCDVSPSNVFVCRDGSVKLLDFGVAKVIDAYDYDTSQTVQGKFPYMAPEQVNRLPVDRRVDVFAVGIVLHEMLSGRRLFAAPTELETLRRVDACEVAPPSLYNADVSVGLDAVVLKALSRDPADRFESGDDMAAALMQVERIGHGRQRVAEFLAGAFPATFAAVCDVCGKHAVPGFACAECGNVIAPEAPSTENVRLDRLAAALSDEDLEPEIIADEPAVVSVAEPYPLQTIDDPRRPPAPALKRALAIAGSVGVIAGVAVLRMYTPSFSTPRIVSRAAPRRDDSQTIKIGPPPPPVCPPTPPPMTLPSRPVVSEPAPPPQPRDDVPTRPLPLDLRPTASPTPAAATASQAAAATAPRAAAATAPQPAAAATAHPSKLGRLALKKVPAASAHKTPAPATAPALVAPKLAEPGRAAVREGALLDPFGKED